MTVFELIGFLMIGAATFVGGRLGWSHFGLLGLLIGGVAGFLLAVLAIRSLVLLPDWGAIHRKKTDEILAMLDGEKYFLFPIALSELLNRNVDVSVH